MSMARRAYASLKEVWGAHRIARRPCEAASAISMQNDSRGSGCYSKISDCSIVARAGGQASAESAARIASWSVRHARAANRRRFRLRAWRAAATPVAEEERPHRREGGVLLPLQWLARERRGEEV